MLKQILNNTMCMTFALLILGVIPAYALDHLRESVPQAEKVGQGRLTYMLWDVYDATLFAPHGIWEEGKPFALRLSYLRKIDGQKIVDRSIQEIRDQGFSDEIKLATWHVQLRKIIPDVEKGVTLTGIFTDSGSTIFYMNDVEIGRIQDSLFRRAFADIWLGERTSAPQLRQKLLGAL